MGRIRENGKSVIFAFDFFDQYIYQYVNMFSKRITEYKKLGYELINENKNKYNQFIFSINNFLENFKVDYNTSKHKMMIKSKKHCFFDEISKLDISKNIIEKIPKNKSIKINAVILDNRISKTGGKSKKNIKVGKVVDN
ncbi:MAG: hypothetical protein K2I67_02915, partial [Malacoplasma sp.]|nr:hypothetical protein [Malacoplasma sp.]